MRRFSLILLICASIGIALAQTAPLRLAGRPLPLPADWESVYEPAEVLFLAKAESDSSLSLVRVLDGKIELEPLLREHLTAQTFALPADSLIAGQELPVILDLSTELQSAALQAAREKQLQADIEGWITRQREGHNFRQPQLPAQESILQDAPEAYRAGFFSYSRPVATTILQVQGFQPQTSIFAPALYLSYYHALLDPLPETGRQEWTEQIYPYHVALSDIEVGLGDFEHRFARGAIQKNTLFGVDRLYLAFAFLVQGGYWLEQNSSLNSLKLALSVPVGVTSLDLVVMDQVSRQSMLTLQPEYWQGNDFLLERRYRTVTAAWRNPWLDISLFHENDTAHAERFLHSLHNDALHLRLARDIKWNAFALSAHYERLFTKRNFELNPANHQDLAALKLSYTGQKLVGEALAELYDWQLPALWGQIGYRGANMEAGAVYQFRAYPASPQSSTGNIYTATDPLYRVDQRERHKLAAYLNWMLLKGFGLKLQLGARDLLQYYHTDSAPETKADAALEEEIGYLCLGAEVNRSWGPWQVEWNPGLTWQSGTKQIFAEPELAGHSHLTLTRHLPYANALLAGFSLLGHSAYKAATDPVFAVETSLIADLWAGVRIGNRFEFLVSYKNIGDANIYGVYPLPRSLHASIRWFYLN